MANNSEVPIKEILIEILIDHFDMSDKYFLLYGDAGFTIVDKLKDRYPNRILNAGIMEQGMIGIASGMAMSGMIPIVFSFTNFLAFRALEQIRNDILLQKQNVKLIGHGIENYYQFLGKTHTCDNDDVNIIAAILGMHSYTPNIYYTNEGVAGCIRDWLNSAYPSYLRI